MHYYEMAFSHVETSHDEMISLFDEALKYKEKIKAEGKILKRTKIYYCRMNCVEIYRCT
jgi:hypothetical protein